MTWIVLTRLGENDKVRVSVEHIEYYARALNGEGTRLQHSRGFVRVVETCEEIDRMLGIEDKPLINDRMTDDAISRIKGAAEYMSRALERDTSSPQAWAYMRCAMECLEPWRPKQMTARQTGMSAAMAAPYGEPEPAIVRARIGDTPVAWSSSRHLGKMSTVGVLNSVYNHLASAKQRLAQVAKFGSVGDDIGHAQLDIEVALTQVDGLRQETE